MDWKNYSSYRLPGGCRRIDGRYHLISQQDSILHLQFCDFASVVQYTKKVGSDPHSPEYR